MNAAMGAAFVLAILGGIAAWAVISTLVVAARDGYRRVPDRWRGPRG